MDITTKTTEELKALAYELIVMRDNAARNLQVVEGELVKRAQATAAAAPEEAKGKKGEKHD